MHTLLELLLGEEVFTRSLYIGLPRRMGHIRLAEGSKACFEVFGALLGINIYLSMLVG